MVNDGQTMKQWHDINSIQYLASEIAVVVYLLWANISKYKAHQ